MLPSVLPSGPALSGFSGGHGLQILFGPYKASLSVAGSCSYRHALFRARLRISFLKGPARDHVRLCSSALGLQSYGQGIKTDMPVSARLYLGRLWVEGELQARPALTVHKLAQKRDMPRSSWEL